MSLTLPSDRYKRVRISAYKEPYTIDIGCGIKHSPEIIGIDVHDNGQAILWDVIEGIPLPDNSVKEIKMYHFLEHVEYKNLDVFFRELRRISIKKAIIDIKVPYSEHADAHTTSHVSFWDEKAFKGVVKGFINSRKERLPILELIMMQLLDNDRILHVKLQVIR